MAAKKKTLEKEELVKLRERPMPSGNISLYLDYLKNGKRERETLGLFLVKAKTPADKESNQLTLLKAQTIRNTREQEILSGKFLEDNSGLNTPFLAYYRQMVEVRHGNPDSQGNWGNWRSCLRYLEVYCNEKTTFKDITPKWVQGFKDFLDTVEKDTYKIHNRRTTKEFNGLSQSSKVSYFNKLRACLNQAHKEHLIYYNPADSVTGFKTPDLERQYLTMEEVKRLAATECRYPQLKRAFLFGCMTGLRKSDIQKLTWGEVRKFGNFTRLVFKQKKTGGQEYLDIPKSAEKYLGERNGAKSVDLVFPSFKYSSETSLELRRWALAAGITKDFTFHCSRHTFAVLLLNSDTDIYTVSKLLGHRELSTTQVYAHLIDKKKQDAVSRITNLFED